MITHHIHRLIAANASDADRGYLPQLEATAGDGDTSASSTSGITRGTGLSYAALLLGGRFLRQMIDSTASMRHLRLISARNCKFC